MDKQHYLLFVIESITDMKWFFFYFQKGWLDIKMYLYNYMEDKIMYLLNIYK